MSDAILLLPGEGEVIGDSEDRRVELLCGDDSLHATWSRFGPGRDGADLHVHRHHTDLFYVLAGELTVLLGVDGNESVAPAGSLVIAPLLVVHGFRNGGDAELRYLNFHAPGAGFADYLRGRRDGFEVAFDSEDPPADGGRPAGGATLSKGDLVLADIDEIGVAEVRGEPDSPSPPPHFHRRHLECFYVLAGEMAFTVGGRELRATPGSWVQVPPSVPHTFAFPSSDEVRFLNIHAPNYRLGALDQEPA